jgi:hypothetical protein
VKNLSLIALTLMSTTAFAHLVQIDDTLIQIADGDTNTAYQMGQTCGKIGLGADDCYDMMGAQDPDRSKAAQKCSQERYVNPKLEELKEKNPNKDEPAGSRGHEIGGKPHTAVMYSAEEGNHFYAADSQTAEAAQKAYEAKLITDAANKKRETNGTESRSKEVTREATLGTSSDATSDGKLGPIKVSGSMGLNSSGTTGVGHTTSKTDPVLSEQELKEITEQSKDALKNPRLGGYDFNVICSDKWEFCVGATGETMRSPLYGKGSGNSNSTPPTSPSDKAPIPTPGAPKNDKSNPAPSEKGPSKEPTTGAI